MTVCPQWPRFSRIAADGRPEDIVTRERIREVFDLDVPVHHVDGRPIASYFSGER